MVDIARLGVVVDSSDLERGERSLRGFSQEGKRTEAQIVRSASNMEESLEDVSMAARRVGRGFDVRGLTMQLSQVSDMAIATGDPLRALAIQGSDIGMLFGGPVAIGFGIAAGAALNLAPSLLGLSGNAETLEDQMESLSSQFARYREAADIALTGTRELREEFGQFADEIARDALFAAELALEDLRAGVTGLTTELDPMADRIRATLVEIGRLGDMALGADVTAEQSQAIERQIEGFQSYANEAAAAFGLTVDQLLQLDSAIDRFRGAESMEDMAAAALDANEQMQFMATAADETPPIIADIFGLMTQVSREAARGALATDALSGSASVAAQEISSAEVAAIGLSNAVSSINFSNAVAGAQSLSQQMNISLQQAMQLMGLVGAAAQAASDAASPIYDPRDPRYDADAAQAAARIERIKTRMDELNQSATRVSASVKNYTGAVADAGRASGGAGRAAGGAAQATEEYTEVLREAERALEEFNRQQEDQARLASDWIGTITDGALNGDLAGAFRSLGNDSRDAFYDALGSGQSISSIFSTGISGVGSGLSAAMGAGNMAGAMAGLGGAISAAMPVIGLATTAIGLISSFSSSEVVGQAVTGRIGGARSRAWDRTTTENSRFWGLSTSTDIDYESNDSLSRALTEAAHDTMSTIGEMAEGFGGAARSLGSAHRMFEIDTEGMDAEAAQRAVMAEMQAYQEEVAIAAMGTTRFIREGQSAVETMQSLTDNLSAYNDVQRLLGLDTLPRTIENAATARRILDRVGGEANFSAQSGIFFSEFMTDRQRLRRLEGQLGRELSDIRGVDVSSIGSRSDFRNLVRSLSNRGRDGDAADLMAQSGLVDSIFDIREAMEAAADATRDAERATRQQERAERELNRQRLRGFYDTRNGLRMELAELRGQDRLVRELRDAERERQLEGLTEAQQVVQERIFALQDLIEAEREAADAERERAAAVDEALRGAVFSSFYDERRAMIDAAAGRNWRMDYNNPELSNTPTGTTQQRIAALLEALLEQATISTSANMKTSAATQQMERGQQILVSQGAA